MSSPPTPPHAPEGEGEAAGAAITSAGEEDAPPPSTLNDSDPSRSRASLSASEVEDEADQDEEDEDEDEASDTSYSVDDDAADYTDDEGDGTEGQDRARVLEAAEVAEGTATTHANCCVCMEAWTSDGKHRVCCVPCGHVYGRSCLERWLRRCGGDAARCPQCGDMYERDQIINLYTTVCLWKGCSHQQAMVDLGCELRDIKKMIGDTNEKLSFVVGALKNKVKLCKPDELIKLLEEIDLAAKPPAGH